MQGAWLGRAEDSDAHITYSEGKVTENRTIRRYACSDPRRWDVNTALNLKVTPWRQDIDVRAQVAAAGMRESVRALVAGSMSEKID